MFGYSLVIYVVHINIKSAGGTQLLSLYMYMYCIQFADKNNTF